MNLEQLTYIVEVAEAGSLADASEKIHVTQSAISQSITNLEKKLGVKIFHRSRSGTAPTEAGSKIILKAMEILGKMEELQMEANADLYLASEKLRLGTIPSPLMYLPKTLAAFKKDYPTIKMEIAEQSSQAIIDDIADDKLDIGLVGLSREGAEFRNEDIEIQVVLKGSMMVAASEQSTLAHASSITASEIQKHLLVIYDDDRLWEFVDDLCARFGSIDVLFSTNNLDAIRNAVKENLAITIAPDYTIKNDFAVAANEVVPLEIADLTQDYPGMALVWSKSCNTAVMRNFMSRLKTDMLRLQTRGGAAY